MIDISAAVHGLVFKFIDAAPEETDAADVLVALHVVVGMLLCTASDKSDARAVAKAFYKDLLKFVDDEFELSMAEH